jgi:hypothetical protein
MVGFSLADDGCIEFERWALDGMIGGCGICVFVWVGQAGTAVVSCDPFWEADHIAVRTGFELRAT